MKKKYKFAENKIIPIKSEETEIRILSNSGNYEQSYAESPCTAGDMSSVPADLGRRYSPVFYIAKGTLLNTRV